MRSSILAVAAALSLAACGSSTDLQSGEPFTLHVGERAAAGDPSVAVRLVAVPQDSRCPTNVVCVWAGDAVARLDLVSATDSLRVDLHTNGQAGPVRIERSGYVLELLALAPAPVAGSQIPQSEYEATLQLSSK